MNKRLQQLGQKFRIGGNTYGSYRAILFTSEELKEYADLLDPPPRFDERQTALLKAYYDIGAVYARKEQSNIQYSHISIIDAFAAQIGTIFMTSMNGAFMEDELLDLAEMFGEKKE